MCSGGALSLVFSSCLGPSAGEFPHVALFESPLTQLEVGGSVRKLQTLGVNVKCGRDCQEHGRKGKTIWWVWAEDMGPKPCGTRFVNSDNSPELPV